MSEIEIIKLVRANIYQAIDGMSKENNKFDFKKLWYNLKDDLDLNEFLKDVSSIVNTPGPDGYIVIGFDDKSKKYKQSVFSDCGLKDKNEVIGILIRRVDKAFEINIHDVVVDENKLSIIHIPPSFEKPHFIKNYKSTKKEEEQRIFVRNDTTTKIAGRNDLEKMLWDNKNVNPEWSLDFSINKSSINFFKSKINEGNLEMGISSLIIENLGRRNVAISKINLNLTIKKESDIVNLIFSNAKAQSNDGNYEEIKHKKLIIKPNDIGDFRLKLYTQYSSNDPYSITNYLPSNIENIAAEITLSNNKNIIIDVILIE